MQNLPFYSVFSCNHVNEIPGFSYLYIDTIPKCIKCKYTCKLMLIPTSTLPPTTSLCARCLFFPVNYCLKSVFGDVSVTSCLLSNTDLYYQASWSARKSHSLCKKCVHEIAWGWVFSPLHAKIKSVRWKRWTFFLGAELMTYPCLIKDRFCQDCLYV